jgi:two-component system chemotaxis response regulator CheB
MSDVSPAKIRVLVVDDSAFVRKALIRIYAAHPEIRIIDVAADGRTAVELTRRLRPDVVTLDIRMPVLDGLAALGLIMEECPTPVIMLSTLTERGGENTLKALEMGAVDFVDKADAGGHMEIYSLSEQLTTKIRAASRVDLRKLRNGRYDIPEERHAIGPTAKSGAELVVIGSSTGGPQALQQIVTRLPEGFPLPVLVVQHMPRGFTASLADRLNVISALTVKEAVEGEEIIPGKIYIAPAGRHLKVGRDGTAMRVRLDDSPEDEPHRPSIDTVLQSVAAICGERSIVFILTGMGKDGAAGACAVKKTGGRVYVESEETAVIYGMPKAVAESVRVDGHVPLYRVAETILRVI